MSKYVPWIQRNLKNFTDAHIILNPWRNQAILGSYWIRNYFNILDHHNLYLIHWIFYFWLHYGEKRETIGNEKTRRQKTATRTKLSIQTILDLMNHQIIEFLHLMKCLLLKILMKICQIVRFSCFPKTSIKSRIIHYSTTKYTRRYDLENVTKLKIIIDKEIYLFESIIPK